ncbi:MAG: thioredoxin family protein [Candidatus Delongbacteria bacterium]
MKRILIMAVLAIMQVSLITGCTKKSEDEKENAAQPKKEVKETVWMNDLEKAIEKAAAEDKTVLVNFTGSDWCGWCMKLKAEVFSKDEFAEYAEGSLVLVELDFPQKKEQTDEIKKYNRKKLEKYGVRGFPTILLIDGEGKEIGRTGYQQGGPVAYVEHIKSFIKK